MLCDVDTSQRHDLLAHRGLLYGSEEEFLASALPFIRDGLNRGDRVCSVSTERNAGWLRRELGTDAGDVEFRESSRWYQHPVRALATAHRLVQATIPDGQRLRVIAEPLGCLGGRRRRKSGFATNHSSMRHSPEPTSHSCAATTRASLIRTSWATWLGPIPK